MTPSIDPRRRFVVGAFLGAGALLPWSTLSLAASGNASGRRFVLVILRGGMNVYPREVEEVIYTHPDVVEVAVVGMPDEMMGEQVGAAVALREGATTTPEEIIEFTKERIAAYKYPRKVWVVPELPKGPTGKILRREVHAPAEG